jgi:hypothetical protein
VCIGRERQEHLLAVSDWRRLCDYRCSRQPLRKAFWVSGKSGDPFWKLNPSHISSGYHNPSTANSVTRCNSAYIILGELNLHCLQLLTVSHKGHGATRYIYIWSILFNGIIRYPPFPPFSIIFQAHTCVLLLWLQSVRVRSCAVTCITSNEKWV